MKKLNLKSIWHDTVWSKVIAGLIVAAILGFIGYTRNWSDHKPHDTTEISNGNANHTDSAPTPSYSNESGMLFSGKLPYLKNLPILDQTLFLRYNYNELLFGGKNLYKVAIEARSKMGSDLPLGSSLSPDGLHCDITKEPRIEFSYRDLKYALDVNGSHYDFSFNLKEIVEPTMDLHPVQEYR